MPVSKPSELPADGDGRWPGIGFPSTRWGDMEVGYTKVDPLDATAVYEGLPGAVCQCPHYGYVFSGQIRCTYPGTDWPDEIAVTGEAYFFPAGHILMYDEPSEILEFNPAFALEQLMLHIAAKARAAAEISAS
jgi:hypothetical protein